MTGFLIFLFLAGLCMVCLEIFIPGGIVGTAGSAAVIASFWLAYTRVGSEFGVYFISFGLVILMAAVSVSMVYFPRTRFSNRVFLGADQKGFKSSDESNKKIEGMEGVAATRLRPSGIARIDGGRYSVIADDYIEAGAGVKVVDVRGSRIRVKKINRGQEKGP